MTEEIKEEKGMRRLYATALSWAVAAVLRRQFQMGHLHRHRACSSSDRDRTALLSLAGRTLPISAAGRRLFVLVFGGLTVWLQTRPSSLKPTIVNCLFGVILGGGLPLMRRLP
jgi:intracellular septation protein